MSASWWITFANRPPACIEAETPEIATKDAEELGRDKVVSVDRLPYPAEPRLNFWQHNTGSVCPSFCIRPERCKGKSSCPNNPSCTE